MVVDGSRYEELISADGGGAFDHVEFEGGGVVLRSMYLKTADMSGSVRFYFDANREQVATGRRFDPISGQWMLRAGVVYRVYTNVVFDKPVPGGVRVEVMPTDDSADVLMVINPVIRPGFEGRVYFTIQPFRRVQVDEKIMLATLTFSEDREISAVPKKSANYSRRKKKSTVDYASVEEGQGASSLSDEQSESGED